MAVRGKGMEGGREGKGAERREERGRERG